MDPYILGKVDGHRTGKIEGIQFAITWLHKHARNTADEHEKKMCNGAAYRLGKVLKYHKDRCYTNMPKGINE